VKFPHLYFNGGKMETIESLKKEMNTWEGKNQALYKQALYKYNALLAQQPQETKVIEVIKPEIIEEEEEVEEKSIFVNTKSKKGKR
jgi:hypothetical protein